MVPCGGVAVPINRVNLSLKFMKLLRHHGVWLACILLGVFSGGGVLRAESPAAFNVGGFTFTHPTSWESVEVTSPMRKAQFKVKSSDGKTTADVVFFQFAGGAGTVEANVKRWLGQF